MTHKSSCGSSSWVTSSKKAYRNGVKRLGHKAPSVVSNLIGMKFSTIVP